jgi:hypothetical protein
MAKPVHWTVKEEVRETARMQTGDSLPENFSGLRISLIKLGGFIIFAASCLLLLLVNAALSWWALLLPALPVYLFLAWLGEKVFAEKYGWSTSQVGFSITRIILGVSVVLAFFGAIFLLWRWAS